MERKSLSSIDLGFLARELKILEGAKVDAIFQYESIVYIQFHVTNIGKKILKFSLPNFAFITEARAEKEKKQSAFSTILKKHLLNSRLTGIKQHKNERILVMCMETKEQKYNLIAELFSQGNLILCDEKNQIIGCLTTKKWAQREVISGTEYNFPDSKNPFDLTLNETEKIFLGSEKESLVKSIAIDLGLGGLYAEEICIRANLSKGKKPNEISKNDVKSVHEQLQLLKKSKARPIIVYESGKVADISPVKMEYYKNMQIEEQESFSTAIETFLKMYRPKKINKYEKEIEKLMNIIEAQEKQSGKINEEVEDNRKKGDLIYEKYSVVNDILSTLKKAREKHSWKEIKEKLKGHKVVKSVDEKEGKIVIEL